MEFIESRVIIKKYFVFVYRKDGNVFYKRFFGFGKFLINIFLWIGIVVIVIKVFGCWGLGMFEIVFFCIDEFWYIEDM